MAIPTAIRRPPRSPRTLRITADAGVVVAASPSVPSTRTQTTFTATYTITTPITPRRSPMTRSRSGRFNSPEMKLAVCQPP